MEEFYLWDLEIRKFRCNEKSVIKEVFAPKEFKKKYPESKIYNPKKMPIIKLKDGEFVFMDASKVYF